MTGTMLERAAFETGSNSQDAENFYNLIEDILSALEAQAKQVQRDVTQRVGADAALMFQKRAQLQQQGIRLILAALARKVDPAFKEKVSVLREGLYETRTALPKAIAALRQEDALTADLGIASADRDYERIEVRASLIAMSFLGW